MATTLTQAEIYLTKCFKVILPDGSGQAAPEVVATAAKNLQSLGFGLSTPLLERLTALSEEQIVGWYESVLPILQRMVGAHREFNPVYPNFPKQVMEASDAELFFNAMTHYYGFWLSDLLGDPNLVVLPNYEREARPILEEFHELRWIDLGTEEDFDTLFTRLAASNGSLSDFDKEVLRWFVTERSVEGFMRQINNAARNSVGFTQIGQAIVNLSKPTLFDLFRMHAEGRGEIVQQEDRATTVFGLYEGTVTAFDTSVLMSQYLV